MSLTEILAEIPKLSFSERQELVRRAIAIEDDELNPEENAILDQRPKNRASGKRCEMDKRSAAAGRERGR